MDPMRRSNLPTCCYPDVFSVVLRLLRAPGSAQKLQATSPSGGTQPVAAVRPTRAAVAGTCKRTSQSACTCALMLRRLLCSSYSVPTASWTWGQLAPHLAGGGGATRDGPGGRPHLAEASAALLPRPPFAVLLPSCTGSALLGRGGGVHVRSATMAAISCGWEPGSPPMTAGSGYETARDELDSTERRPPHPLDLNASGIGSLDPLRLGDARAAWCALALPSRSQAPHQPPRRRPHCRRSPATVNSAALQDARQHSSPFRQLNLSRVGEDARAAPVAPNQRPALRNLAQLRKAQREQHLSVPSRAADVPAAAAGEQTRRRQPARPQREDGPAGLLPADPGPANTAAAGAPAAAAPLMWKDADEHPQVVSGSGCCWTGGWRPCEVSLVCCWHRSHRIPRHRRALPSPGHAGWPAACMHARLPGQGATPGKLTGRPPRGVLTFGVQAGQVSTWHFPRPPPLTQQQATGRGPAWGRAPGRRLRPTHLPRSPPAAPPTAWRLAWRTCASPAA